MAIFSQQSHLNECLICQDPIDADHPGGAIDHSVANAVSHHFHIDCMQDWANNRQAQGLDITCPVDSYLASGVNEIPFAPLPPGEVSLQALLLLPNFQLFAEITFDGRFFHGQVGPAEFFNIPAEVELLAMAAFNGDLASVQAAIVKGNISDEVHLLALKGASAGGHLNIVQALLNNRIISDMTRGSAVIFAARHGRLDVIQALLANEYITRNARGEAVVDASKQGHLDVVLALMANRNISDYAHRDALVFASINGHLDIVQAWPTEISLSTLVLGLC